MDNVGIVVEDFDATVDFFRALSLDLEDRAMIEAEWSKRATGLGDQQVKIAMMPMPDGRSRLEISRFLTPAIVADHRIAPVNALGYFRAMFTFDAIHDTLKKLCVHGIELVGAIVDYKDVYRLWYIRGPEELVNGLAE